MKIPRIMNAVGHIDDDLIAETEHGMGAAKKKAWYKWGAVAACFAAVLMAGAIIAPMLNGGEADPTVLGGIERNYKDLFASELASDIEWPWEYKTAYERFSTITFDGNKYLTRAREIDESLVGEELGSCLAEGYDHYSETKYTETFEVRKITGVSEDRLVAVNVEGTFYVYLREGGPVPATLGEMMDMYGLARTLELSHFTEYEGYSSHGYYILNDDAYIMQILSECQDAEAVESEGFAMNDRRYISFTVTSEPLGAYKKAFNVTEDGYVWTNIFNYAYLYNIGEDAAEKMIENARTSSVETDGEPYEYTLAGTLVEIGDGYVLVDDTVLCADMSDGMVFKVPTEDLRIRRSLRCLNIDVGDIVVVKFRGDIDVGAGNLVVGAYSLGEGELIDGGLAVWE